MREARHNPVHDRLSGSDRELFRQAQGRGFGAGCGADTPPAAVAGRQAPTLLASAPVSGRPGLCRVAPARTQPTAPIQLAARHNRVVGIMQIMPLAA